MMHEAIIAVNRVNILEISVPLFIFLLKLIISAGLLLNGAIKMNEQKKEKRNDRPCTGIKDKIKEGEKNFNETRQVFTS